MEAFWAAITALGDIRLWLAALLLISLCIFAAKPRTSARTKRALVTLVITFVVVSLSAQAIKMVVDAPRICTLCPADGCIGQSSALPMQVGACPPCNPYCPADDPYGFPSGHAALSFAMFTTLWFATGRNNGEKVKWSWIFILPILASMSRLALGVHTPEQVVAGAVLGVVAAVSVRLLNPQK